MFIPATKAASQPASFTTDEDGYFAFPKGLGVGTYRILETTPDPNYENIYSADAYTFQVVDRNVQISLYNPKKLTLDLEKAAADTQAPLSGAAFALKEGKRATTLTATTNSEGKASFSGIGSGVYTLSETEAAAGYSKDYLETYLQATYADGDHVWETYALSGFATEGIFLGFVTEARDDQVVVHRKGGSGGLWRRGPDAAAWRTPPSAA